MTEKRKPGRPPSTGPKLQRITITLEAADIEKARKLGNGSASAGVRVALSMLPNPPQAPGGGG